MKIYARLDGEVKIFEIETNDLDLAKETVLEMFPKANPILIPLESTK